MKKQILFTESEIKNKVGEIAYNLKKKEHDFPPVFICVLNGAFMFFTDLVKQMNECEIDFIRAKSYEGITQGTIQILKSAVRITGYLALPFGIGLGVTILVISELIGIIEELV